MNTGKIITFNQVVELQGIEERLESFRREKNQGSHSNTTT